MDWLIDTIAPALSIRNTTQACTWQQTNASWDHARLITDDISKQVAGDHDPIESPWALHQQHSCAIDQVMPDLQLRELLFHNLSNHLSPQSTRRQHVRLVQAPDWKRGVVLQSQVCRKSCDPLNFRSRVWFSVPGNSVPIVLLSLTKVDATGQLTDDVEVCATAHLGLQGRDIDEGLGGKVAGSEVAIGSHLLAESKNALLGPDFPCTPFWTTNCS